MAPRLRGDAPLRTLKLSPNEGYVLSRVDGRTTLWEICLLVPISRDETLRILRQLRTRGVIEVPGSEEPVAPLPGSQGPMAPRREVSAVRQAAVQRESTGPGAVPQRETTGQRAVPQREVSGARQVAAAQREVSGARQVAAAPQREVAVIRQMSSQSEFTPDEVRPPLRAQPPVPVRAPEMSEPAAAVLQEPVRLSEEEVRSVATELAQMAADLERMLGGLVSAESSPDQAESSAKEARSLAVEGVVQDRRSPPSPLPPGEAAREAGGEGRRSSAAAVSPHPTPAASASPEGEATAAERLSLITVEGAAADPEERSAWAAWPDPLEPVTEPVITLGPAPEPVIALGPEPVIALGPEPVIALGPEPVIALGPEPVIALGPEPAQGDSSAHPLYPPPNPDDVRQEEPASVSVYSAPSSASVAAVLDRREERGPMADISVLRRSAGTPSLIDDTRSAALRSPTDHGPSAHHPAGSEGSARLAQGGQRSPQPAATKSAPPSAPPPSAWHSPTSSAPSAPAGARSSSPGPASAPSQPRPGAQQQAAGSRPRTGPRAHLSSPPPDGSPPARQRPRTSDSMAALVSTTSSRSGPLVVPTAAEERCELTSEQRRRIDEVYGQLNRVDAFTLLGVQRDVDKKSLQRAYYRLSKEFHPDRYFKRELGVYRPRVAAIFQGLTEARDTLIDDAQRAAYLAGE